MSFRNSIKITQIKPYKKQKYSKRKETDSILAIHSNHNLRTYGERASAFTSKGSITVEAAIVIPMFFLAILCLACVLEMMSMRLLMRTALCNAGRDISQQAYSVPMTTGYGVKERIVNDVGEERIEHSLIKGGVSGISCNRTTYDEATAIFDLVLSYQMQVPFPIPALPAVRCEEELRVKGWTGYTKKETGEDADTTVYVTKTGTVYHKDMFCKYLVSSVRTITWEELEEKRNLSGGKYYACEVCGKTADNTGRIYITDYGDRYHVSIGCNSLKRVVYAVPYKEVSEREGCSKCVK